MPPIYRYDRSRRSQSRIYDWLCMHAHINIFFHTMQAIILMAEYMPRIMQCMHACMHRSYNCLQVFRPKDLFVDRGHVGGTC